MFAIPPARQADIVIGQNKSNLSWFSVRPQHLFCTNSFVRYAYRRAAKEKKILSKSRNDIKTGPEKSLTKSLA
jgi:hypothetical protein